ncbi:hypothetical protein R5R35_006346 [Gryllus longicercus]|uniref:Metalloendopeptidase n=1 Tax=Gryllus longicercus TaxID=2509291 RepID=A0AAN9W1V0_9ORTH
MRFLVIFLILDLLATTSAQKIDIPPEPAYKGHFRNDGERTNIARKVAHWTPKEKTTAWEESGLYQGDIMEPDDQDSRNGVEGDGKRWPNATVPYYIHKDFFNKHERKRILSAMDEFHKNTCITFRPYNKHDSTYVVIKGENGGCWSYIGRVSGTKKPGQQLNLQTPNCAKRGTIVHELLHALGFYHQHSSIDRDRYVKILWQNIKPGKESDFQKKFSKDFNVGYDYDSIMHYSAYANSKNKKPTILPKNNKASIGQRIKLSKKDIMKLSTMYRCKKVNGKWKFY